MSKKNINIIFDFDSTIIQLETIEVLADFALKNIRDKNTILKNIKNITSNAMAGKISFDKALTNRISLLSINKSHIHDTMKYLKKKLTKSFFDNLDYIEDNIVNCFVISGGFKEIISPILTPYGFRKENIYANSFIYNKGGVVVGVDNKNPLSKDKGKNIIAKNIKGFNIIVGDGYTDYEIKKYKNAKIFILFIENIFRKELSNNADFIAKNFKETFNFIKNVT